MSSYFDNLMTEFWDIAKLPDEEFLALAAEIETRVIREVSLTTGDREFPGDLREKIQSCIALHAYDYEQYASDGRPRERKIPINEKAKAWLLSLRYSRLCESLHSLFHELASRRIRHRFDSIFFDDPAAFLKQRDAFLAEQAGGRT